MGAVSSNEYLSRMWSRTANHSRPVQHQTFMKTGYSVKGKR
jgi:hypothetical protein